MQPITPPAGVRPPSVRVSQVFSALSFALDITEGQPFGHALRSCLIGMWLADRLGLPIQSRRDLYYGLMLKDVGCSSNAAQLYRLFGGDDRAAKHDLKRVDWANYFRAAQYAMAHALPGGSWLARAWRIAQLAHGGQRAATELVHTRCARGADILSRLGFGPQVVEAIQALDEHWNGHGQPRGLRGEEIPMLGRIMGIAQTLEVFAVLEGAQAAIAVANARKGRWFDPTLVRALEGLEPELARWCELDEQGLQDVVREREPGDAALLAGPGSLDRIAEGFAAVVDAKSPYTGRHSARVTGFALAVAGEMGFNAHEIGELRRAGLLHDIGKLSVPNSILDKPTKLSSEEWETMRLHPYYTQRILEQINGFEGMAHIAASHHERIDGRGYHRGLRGEAIPIGGRLLAVADVFEALTSNRPYRPALPDDLALAIMEKDRGIGLDGDCLDALTVVVHRGSEYELRAGAEMPASPVPADALTRFVAEPAAMAAKAAKERNAAVAATITSPIGAPRTNPGAVPAPAAAPASQTATVEAAAPARAAAQARTSYQGPREVPVEADDYWMENEYAPPPPAADRPRADEDEQAA